MTYYIETVPGMDRGNCLAPVRVIELTPETATVEITRTVRCYKRGDRMTLKRSHVLEKCGRQRGRYVGFSFGHNFNRNDIYVRPARLTK